MPSSSSQPETPLRTLALDRLAPASTRSTRSTRSRSQTPTLKVDVHAHAHPHHHQTADEQMLKEAEKILSTPTGRRTRNATDAAGSPFTPGGSARDLRHAKILEAREKEEKAMSQIEGSRSSREGTGHSEVLESISTPSNQRERVAKGKGREIEREGTEEATIGPRGKQNPRKAKGSDLADSSVTDEQSTLRDDNSEGSVIIVGVNDNDNSGKVPIREEENKAEDENEEDGSAESESDDSDSEEDGDSDESSSDDDDNQSDEDSDEEEERLERLLQAARISAMARSQGEQVSATETPGDGEVVLQFDEQEKKAAPIPDLTIPSLPPAHISFAKDGSAKASSSTLAAPSGPKKSLKGKERAPELELDNRPYERALSKREKAAQPKKATPSELWATIPSARRDALPQMKRDYQALALANSLDPKRFMKGSAKSTKVPESFAIGTMVEQPKHLQDTTLVRDVRYRPGQIVQGLVQDEVMNATAKRKYGDLQYKRMENGRGKGWKKRSKW